MKKVELKQKLKRKEIALSAIPLIDQKGFSNISVNELCNELSISIGTFYHYFKDKNDIIREFFVLIDEYYKSEVEDNVTVYDNSLLNIRYFCAYYAYYCSHCGFEVCRQISIVPLLSSDEKFISDERYLFQLLLKFIEQGQNKNQISKDYTSTQICNMLLNMLRGYCADWCKNNGEYDIISYIDLNCNVYLKFLNTNENCISECINHKIKFKEFNWFNL